VGVWKAERLTVSTTVWEQYEKSSRGSGRRCPCSLAARVWSYMRRKQLWVAGKSTQDAE